MTLGTNASAATPATPSASTNASAGGGTTRGKDAAPGAALAAGQPANVDARVRITNVGPTSFDTSSNDPAISVEAVDDTGNTDTSVTFFGGIPRRVPTQTRPIRSEPGRACQNCLTYLVPGGITKVAYTGTDAHETSPVTWTMKMNAGIA